MGVCAGLDTRAAAVALRGLLLGAIHNVGAQPAGAGVHCRGVWGKATRDTVQGGLTGLIYRWMVRIYRLCSSVFNGYTSRQKHMQVCCTRQRQAQLMSHDLCRCGGDLPCGPEGHLGTGWLPGCWDLSHHMDYMRLLLPLGRLRAASQLPGQVPGPGREAAGSPCCSSVCCGGRSQTVVGRCQRAGDLV